MDRPSSEWPIPPTAAGGPAHPESPRPASALSRFVARLSYATDAVAAAALVAEITADAGGGLIAVDFETAPFQASGRASQTFGSGWPRQKGRSAPTQSAALQRDAVPEALARQAPPLKTRKAQRRRSPLPKQGLPR